MLMPVLLILLRFFRHSRLPLFDDGGKYVSQIGALQSTRFTQGQAA
jgi:hypothetical protein